MKIVHYEDVPRLCEQLLHEIDANGTVFEVLRDGRPFVRMVPIEEADLTQNEAANTD